MNNYQKLMMGHAILILIVALLAGFMLGFGLIGGLEVWPGMIVDMPYYGNTEGWVRAHTGGLTNGLLVLGLALALPHIRLTGNMQRLTAYGIIFAGWANTVFYWLGNAAGTRALSFADNPLGMSNIYGVIGYSLALPAAFLLLLIMLVFAFKLLWSQKM